MQTMLADLQLVEIIAVNSVDEFAGYLPGILIIQFLDGDAVAHD